MNKKKNSTYIYIMAGGIGSRFWPASHSGHPKQFHRLIDKDRSLIQSTYDRFRKLVPASHIFVITSEAYVELTAEHLPELAPHQIIAEPCMRNTAPATLLGTLVAHRLDPEATLIFTPADHTIELVDRFVDRLRQGVEFLDAHDGIVTLGIQATEPHTGYGYIHYLKADTSPYEVVSFKEKPQKSVAEQYLLSGDYLWNSGIFMWKAAYFIDLFKKLGPEMYAILKNIYIDDSGTISSSDLRINYPKLESISVDYMIMERASDVYTIPGDFGWSDIGNWRALYGYLKAADQTNVIQADKYLLRETNNCLIRSTSGKAIIVKGLDNYCIVESEKAILIYPMDSEQEIKQIRNEVAKQFGDDYV